MTMGDSKLFDAARYEYVQTGGPTSPLIWTKWHEHNLKSSPEVPPEMWCLDQVGRLVTTSSGLPRPISRGSRNPARLKPVDPFPRPTSMADLAGQYLGSSAAQNWPFQYHWTPLRSHDLCRSGETDNPERLWNQGCLKIGWTCTVPVN